MLDWLPFKHVVAVDFEFEFGGHDSLEAASRSGERPRPVCMVAKDLRTGQTWRMWRGEFGSQLPFPIDVLVAFYASAELGCFRALGLPFPTYVLDLFTEFRARTNGRNTPNGASLLGALTYFGLDGIDASEKEDLRLLILSGGPWSAADRAAILQYCENDVLALARLLPVMLPQIDLPRALLRGRFMKAAALVEWNGVPIDTATLALLRRYWTDIQDDLIAAVDHDYGVFDGRTFRLERWQRWFTAQGIPWPQLESGRFDLSDDTFRQMARTYPAVSPMRELRSALSEMRLSDLAVGSDGRGRTLLSAFRSRTGRCQPSNTRYIFGPSVWLRNLINRRPDTVSRMWIGASRNTVLPLCSPATPSCRQPTRRATLTYPLPNRLAPSRPTPPSTHMVRSASCSSNAPWLSHMGWRPKVLLAASVNRRLLGAI
jgi:hypothetical protein